MLVSSVWLGDFFSDCQFSSSIWWYLVICSFTDEIYHWSHYQWLLWVPSVIVTLLCCGLSPTPWFVHPCSGNGMWMERYWQADFPVWVQGRDEWVRFCCCFELYFQNVSFLSDFDTYTKRPSSKSSYIRKWCLPAVVGTNTASISRRKRKILLYVFCYELCSGSDNLSFWTLPKLGMKAFPKTPSDICEWVDNCVFVRMYSVVNDMF